MNCVKCSAELPEGAQVCPGCGAAQAQPKKKGNAFKRILISVLSIAVAVGVRYAIPAALNAINEAQLTKTYAELDAMAAEQPVVVTGYLMGEWEDKTGSGPLVQALLQNNSGKTITKIKLAFATWDSLGLTVNLTFDDGKYANSNVAEVTYDNIEFVAGGTYGEEIGLGLSSTSKLPERIQAIPVEWTYADGEKVVNSDYKYFLHNYQDKVNVRSDLAEPQFPEKIVMTEDELAAELAKQPLTVTECKLDQWAEGDLLCATVKNNSEESIKTILIAYATFDAEGKPVNITWSDGEKAESNVVMLRMKDLALATGGEYGSDKGVGLHGDSAKVASFKAIVYYYEDVDGNAWENPLYQVWEDLYEAE